MCVAQKLLLVYLVCLPLAQGEFNYSAYEVLPTLFTLDDYDRCMHTAQEQSNNTYCIVYAEIIPNETSILWQSIEKYSEDRKRHYQHDRLFRGVCVQRCQKLMQSFEASRLREFYQGETRDEDIAAFMREIYANNGKEEYEQLLGSCLNYMFQRKHELGLRTSIAYCEQKNKPLSYDNLDKIFLVILVSILCLNICSSLYDYRLKCKQPFIGQERSFYQSDCTKLSHRIITAFSLCRNYYRITMRPPRVSIAHDLRYFDAFRVICVPIIIMAHLCFIASGLPMKNQEFVEKYFHSLESIIFLNGTAAIQIFFVISGFLLLINFGKLKLITEKSTVVECIGVWTKLLIYRYLRFLPSVLFLILFSGSIMIHLQDGPVWLLATTQAERVFCRKYWWKNLFYINNFSMKYSCCLHTWYLAADMQLFEIYLIVLILAARFPKHRRTVYGIMLLFSFAVPAFVTYFQELDGNFHLQPETYRYFFFKDAEVFFKSYVPSYMNLGGYIFGILCAEIYLKVKSTTSLKKYQGKLRYEVAWWLALPALLGLVLTGIILSNQSIEKPSIWLALYAALYRNLWVILSCCLIIGMIYKVGWIGYQFLRLPLFNILAKISFQAYLWHVVLIRFQANFTRQPLYVNRLVLINVTLSTYILTNVVAFIVCLTLEYPMGELLKIVFNSRLTRSVKNSSAGTDVKTIKGNDETIEEGN